MRDDSLAHKVYMDIRAKILANQLVSGTRLKEDNWAKKMEVSRVAVREALNRLLGENLLVKGEKGGCFVKTLDLAEIKEIRELREVLEVGALRLAVQRVDNKQVAELEKICDDFSNMVQNGYFSGACEADIKFHETLMKLSGNHKLSSLYQRSNIPLFHLKLGKQMTHMNDYDLTNTEHRQIVDAIKARDTERAEKVLVAHLLRGELESIDE